MRISNPSDNGMTRLKVPGQSGLAPVLGRLRRRVPRLDGMLVVAVVLASMLGAPLLEMMGIAYVRQGGSLVEKLHPATYVILAAFVRLLIGSGDVVAFLVQTWPRQKAAFLFLVALAVVAALGVMRHGTGGLAYLIDAFVTPVLLAILLGEVSSETRARLFRIAMLLLTINAAVAIGEVATHKALIGFRHWAGEDFRASAFLGHPLENALATVPIVVLAFGLATSGRGGFATVILGGLGLLAFGGRAAALLVGVAIVAMIAADTAHRLATRSLSLNRIVVYLTVLLVGPAALAIVLATSSLGDRIVSHLFLDTSAEVRVASFDIFHYISKSQLWYGIDNDAMANLMESLTFIGVIENFWIALIVSLGIYSVAMFMVGFVPYLLMLAGQGGLPVALAVGTFVAVASTSNSLATKTTTLSLLTLFALCYRDYTGERETVPMKKIRSGRFGRASAAEVVGVEVRGSPKPTVGRSWPRA